MNHYENEEQIQAVVSGFEQCTTPKDGFKHASHLAVAAYYLSKLNKDDAVAKMREGLFRFLDHHGIDRAKYDEQVTRNWINLIQQVMEEDNASLITTTNKVLERLGNYEIPKRSRG